MESVRIEASVEKAVAELGLKPGAGDGAFIDLRLEYFRGEPKAGWPTMIRLTAPPAAENLRIVAHYLKSKEPTVFLFHCLPPQVATAEFLERLSLSCLETLTREAMRLLAGDRLFRKFEEIASKRLAEEAAFPL